MSAEEGSASTGEVSRNVSNPKQVWRLSIVHQIDEQRLRVVDRKI
jgi:hypothetical protein